MLSLPKMLVRIHKVPTFNWLAGRLCFGSSCLGVQDFDAIRVLLNCSSGCITDNLEYLVLERGQFLSLGCVDGKDDPKEQHLRD
jgi:hypothetical protein